MAYAAAPTESGGAKLHFLTTDGNVAAGWFGIDTGVTGTGANTVAFAAIATHVHDDAAGAPGGLATTSVPLVLVGGVRDDALGGLTPAEGDAVYLLVDADGALWTHDNALDAALDGSELQVDVITMPTVAVTNAGLTELAAAINASRMDVNIAASIALDVSAATVTVDTELAAAVAAVDSLANPTVPQVLSHLMLLNGAVWDRAPGSAADGMLVNLGANNDVTITGTVTVADDGSFVLAANSGVDIGDVDIFTMPGTAAEAAALPSVFVVVAGDDGADTHPLQVDASGFLKMSIEVDNVGIGGGTQYAVDAPLGATPTGTLAIAIRDNALGGLTPAEGDAIGLRVDANGALWTHDDVLDVALAGSELQVDIVASLPAGTNNIGDVDVLTLPATAAEAAALPSVFVVVAGDDGVDTHPLQVAADGDLKVTLDSESVAVTNAGLTELADAINANRMDVNIEASVALDVSAATVVVDSELPTAAALANGVANPTVPAVGAFLMGWNETTWDRLVSSIVNGLEVDVTRVQGNVAVTHAGLTELADAINTNRMDVNIAASIGLVVDLGGDNDVTVDGSVVHDAPDSGGLGPVKIGGRAQSSEAQPDEVADEDRVDALFDRSGYLRVRGDFDPQFADINDALSGNNTIVAAQAAGKRIAVWSYFIVADGTVDVRWEDGASGTPFTGQIPLQEREGWVSPAGGLVPLFVGSAATLLNLELSAAVSVHGSVSFTVIDD